MPRLNWYCVRCKLGREQFAVDELRQKYQIDAFFPRIRKKPSVSNSFRRPLEGLFPGYIFAKLRLEDSHYSVQHTSGVAYVVRFGDTIPAVPPDVIDELWSITENALSERSGLEAGRIVANSQVIFRSGPFEGLLGTVVRLSPKDRLRVLVELLGGRSCIDIAKETVLPLDVTAAR